MIAGMVGNILLREVPPLLLSGVDSGKFRVFGSIIRNASNGQIVGFLQEAAPLAPLLANPATALPAAAGLAAKVALQAGQLVQGEVIRRGVRRVEAGVGRVEQGVGRIESKLDVMDQSLGRIESGVASLNRIGLTNLAISAAGVGISVVGFTVMAAKLDGIKRAISGISEQIEIVGAKVDRVQHDLIEADFSELRALAKGYDQGWLLGDAGAQRQWQQIAHDALRFQTRFEARADHILAGDVANYLLADPMLDAVGFASGLRVAALAAANETVAAQQAGADGARTIERLTGGIGLSDFARNYLSTSKAMPGSQDWAVALAAANEGARETVSKLRQREAAAFTRAAPLRSLQRRGIAPRDWLAAAREEKESPVLLMMEEDTDEDRDPAA